MEQLAGKVVLITGASSGIGEATARRLVAQGAKVVLSARRKERLEALAAQLGAEQVAFLPLDVTRREDMEALVSLAQERFGKVDALFANAGVMPAGNLSEWKVEDWTAMVEVNIKGVLYAMAAVLPEMIAQKRGHILVTSSVAGTRAVPGNAVYCGTKHFVRALLESFRAEAVLEGTNLRTTILYPGAVQTERLHTIAPSETKTAVEAVIDKIIELSKAGKLREIADVRDETDLSGLCIAIDCKRGVDPDRLMARLFKLTTLEDFLSRLPEQPVHRLTGETLDLTSKGTSGIVIFPRR